MKTHPFLKLGELEAAEGSVDYCSALFCTYENPTITLTNVLQKTMINCRVCRQRISVRKAVSRGNFGGCASSILLGLVLLRMRLLWYGTCGLGAIHTAGARVLLRYICVGSCRCMAYFMYT